jgi:1-acyl-sn-glycerol-3-phosphate acyltransferase
MFSNDLDNVKNSMKVLGRGGVIVMMPEARLSTIGKFEGIQKQTFKFLQKTNVNVYALKLDGSYLAKPKWSDCTRRGSVVEGELYQLFKAGEPKELSLEEIETRVNSALDYDDWKWLKTRPEIEYRCKTLAQGLENILSLCPECKAKYSMTTKSKTITCEKCGFTRELNSRYEFTNPIPFENFAQWYEYQTQEMAKEIENTPDFALTQQVTLLHASKDGKKMLREAGKGVCTFDKNGLTYVGEEDGNQIEKLFPLSNIYRVLFGAGEDFELYQGSEIYYFRPTEKRSCVDWYIASKLLKERYSKEND